jgi:aspartate/methionine/tyrosine aminotransferase
MATSAFKEAAAGFMRRVYGIDLDPATQVNHAIGSKPALAILPLCFINPGDITLLTVPGYPVARHLHQVLRRQRLPAAAAGREQFLSGFLEHSGRRVDRRRSCWC